MAWSVNLSFLHFALQVLHHCKPLQNSAAQDFVGISSVALPDTVGKCWVCTTKFITRFHGHVGHAHVSHLRALRMQLWRLQSAKECAPLEPLVLSSLNSKKILKVALWSVLTWLGRPRKHGIQSGTPMSYEKCEPCESVNSSNSSWVRRQLAVQSVRFVSHEACLKHCFGQRFWKAIFLESTRTTPWKGWLSHRPIGDPVIVEMLPISPFG